MSSWLAFYTSYSLKGYNTVQWTSTLDSWQTFGKIVILLLHCEVYTGNHMSNINKNKGDNE